MRGYKANDFWYLATVTAAGPGPPGVHPQQGERYDLQYDDGESDAGMRLSDVGHPDNFTDEDEDEEVDVEVDEESPSEQQEGMPGEAPEEHTDILSAPEEEHN